MSKLSLRLLPLMKLMMKEKRVQIKSRVTPLAKRMLNAEAKAMGTNIGRVVDQLAYKNCKSAAARALLQEYGATDPLCQAVMDTAAKELDKRPPRKPGG